MPRKTKDINEEKIVEKQSKLNEKIDAFIKTVLENDTEVVDAKKTASKTKSASTTKTKTTKSKTTKAKTDKSTVKEKATKTVTKAKAEKATPKKATKSKVEKEDLPAKKATKKAAKAEKAEEKETKKATAKKSTKTATKSSSAKTTKAKSTTSKTKVATKSKVKSAKVVAPTIVEYYDLPYKYNQTVVKVLYQNPTTLFVYWEISDSDIANYKNMYGDNFFETTRPVLVVYNDTMNYSFEININDFANSWYFNINDSKCNYRVELIRRPGFYNERIKTDYIFITSSNRIETPNDRILFSTNEPYTVYFRNTKNNMQRKVNLPKLLEQLNLLNKDFGFPIVRNVYDLYKNVYHVEDVDEFSVSLTNPSSRGGNPSSHSLSSRFI